MSFWVYISNDDVMYVTRFFNYYSVIIDNTHFEGVHTILPWISIWKLKLSLCSLYTLFMRRILFCISIENFIEMFPLIYHGSCIFINQLLLPTVLFCKISDINIVYDDKYAWLRFHFIYIYYEFYIYLQLFTTILIHVWDVMAYVSFGYENWLIVLRCFSILVIYSFIMLVYCTVVIKIANLFWKTQLLILFLYISRYLLLLCS